MQTEIRCFRVEGPGKVLLTFEQRSALKRNPPWGDEVSILGRPNSHTTGRSLACLRI